MHPSPLPLQPPTAISPLAESAGAEAEGAWVMQFKREGSRGSTTELCCRPLVDLMCNDYFCGVCLVVMDYFPFLLH